jgi:hypothetical protein
MDVGPGLDFPPESPGPEKGGAGVGENPVRADLGLLQDGPPLPSLLHPTITVGHGPQHGQLWS